MHESWQSRDLGLAVLNAFSTMSCILFKVARHSYESLTPGSSEDESA